MTMENEAGHTLEIGPKFAHGCFDEFWFVPLEWKNKKRWAGIETVSRRKSTDIVRVKNIDLFSGWAASAGDPRTLAPFEKAVEMLRNGGIEYIVYIADENDDPELTKQINARLCPIELEAVSGPTYSDLVRAEEVQLAIGEGIDANAFVPYVVDHAFGAWPDEVERISCSSQELADILNRNDEVIAAVPSTAEWVEAVLDDAIADQGQYVVMKIIGSSVRITKESDDKAGTVYVFEKITCGQPYPY